MQVEESEDVELVAPESTCPFCMEEILQDKETFLFVVVCQQCGESQYHESCLEEFARSGKGRRVVSGSTRKKDKDQKLWRKLSSGWYCPKGFGKCEEDCNGGIEKCSMAKVKKAPSTPRWPASQVQLPENSRSATPIARRASTPRRRPPPGLSLKGGSQENAGSSSNNTERSVNRPPLHGRPRSSKGIPSNIIYKDDRVVEWIAPKPKENQSSNKRRYKSPERCNWAAEEREGWNVVGRKPKSKALPGQENGILGSKVPSSAWQKSQPSSKAKLKARSTKVIEKSKPKVGMKITTLPCGKRKELSTASKHWTGWGCPTESEECGASASPSQDRGRKWADVVKQLKPSTAQPLTRSMSAPRSRPVEDLIPSSPGSAMPSTPFSIKSPGSPCWGLTLEKRNFFRGNESAENVRVNPWGAFTKPTGADGKPGNESLWDFHVARGSAMSKESKGEPSLIKKPCPWSKLNLGNIAGGGRHVQDSPTMASKADQQGTGDDETKRPPIVDKRKVLEAAPGPICIWKANDTRKPPLPSVRISTKRVDAGNKTGSTKRAEESDISHTPRTTTYSRVVVQDVFYPEKRTLKDCLDSAQSPPMRSSSLPSRCHSDSDPEHHKFVFGSFGNDGAFSEPLLATGQSLSQGIDQENNAKGKLGDTVAQSDPFFAPNHIQSQSLAEVVEGNEVNKPIQDSMTKEGALFPWKNQKGNSLRFGMENSFGSLLSEGGDVGSMEIDENSKKWENVDSGGAIRQRLVLNVEDIVSRESERHGLSVATPRPFPFPNKWKPPPGLGRDVELDLTDPCQIEAAVNEGFLPRNFRTVFCSSVGFGKCPLGNWCVHAHSCKEFRFEAALQLSKEHPNNRLFPAPPENYKTKLCSDWWGGLKDENGNMGPIKGRCNYGEKCCWAHGCSEFRVKQMIESLVLPVDYKTKLCNEFMEKGTCPSGPTCLDAHGTEEVRREAAVATGAVQNAEHYKLTFCHSALEGSICELGDSCTGAHSIGDLRVKAAIQEQYRGLTQLGYDDPIVLLKTVACPRLCQTHDLSSCNHFHSEKDRLPKITYSMTTCPSWEEIGKCVDKKSCPFVHDYSELRAGPLGLQIPQFCPLPADQKVSNRTLALLKYQKLQRCIAYAQNNFNYNIADADRISQFAGGDIDTAYRIYLGLNSGNVSDRLKTMGEVDVTDDVNMLTTFATGGACLEQLITIVTLFEGDVKKALELYNTRAQVMASQIEIEFSLAGQAFDECIHS